MTYEPSFSRKTHDVYHSGPLYVTRAKKDTQDRRVNGRLNNPPRLFVTFYDDQWGTVRGVETSWDAAHALVPKNVEEIFAAMRLDRDREADELAADKRAQKEQQNWYL